VEREPITDANREAATAGPDITESEPKVTLHAAPGGRQETEPAERVRLGKEAVTEEQTVGDEVRKEHIDDRGLFFAVIVATSLAVIPVAGGPFPGATTAPPTNYRYRPSRPW
jgi:hypothetical protein